MLRITQSTTADAAKHYFGQSLKRGDYYFEGQEIVGSWGGKAAEMLNLTGRVDHEDFLKLLDNFRPDGSRLTARTDKNRRPGYDFTFDVPKSVSVVHALTGDARLPLAMRAAALETMAEMEEEMHTRVRKAGAFHDRKTGKMLWSDFTHFTSRPTRLAPEVEAAILAAHPWLRRFCDKECHLSIPDPHLHMHVYAVNATFDEVEGQWKAGEFMRLKRDANYYQAAYHVRLAGELQKLGYEIEPTAKAFEIAGVPRVVNDVFSRRTKEVEEAAKALGITDPDLKGQLGAKTRRGKVAGLEMSVLKGLWRSFLTEDETHNLERIAAGALSVERPFARDNPTAAAASIKHALDRELERASEVTERRLLATALVRAVGHASVATVRQALKADNTVLDAVVNEERHLTTVEILKEESALMKFIRDGRGTVPPIVWGDYAFKNPLFQADSKETGEQKAAVLHVLKSQDWVVGIVGRAGTGKTTLLKEIDAGLRAQGQRLIVCAPTVEASRGVLREEGFSSADTIEHLLKDEKNHEQLRGSTLWVDEAGMVGNRSMLALLRLAKEQGAARVVLAGDPTQIRSVTRGDALRFFEEQAGLRVARLEAIKRQKNPVLKSVVEAVSRGNVERGFELLEKSGAIHEAEPEESRRALAKAYVAKIGGRWQNGEAKSVLVVSPTHHEGEFITEAIRDELRAVGKLGREERCFNRSVNLSWTETEKATAASYEPDLVVQFKRRCNLFDKGERLRVESVDARAGKVFVRDNLHETYELPLKAAEAFQVYRREKLKVSAGDRLRITENGREGGYRLNNGAMVTVAGFTTGGHIELDNGEVISKNFGHLAHGYVVTADSAQSKTVDTVFAAIGQDSMAAADLRRFYVTISRARDDVEIFTDNREALLVATQRDTPRRSAMELLGAERSRQILQDIHRREFARETEAIRARNRNLSVQHEAKVIEPELEVAFG